MFKEILTEEDQALAEKKLEALQAEVMQCVPSWSMQMAGYLLGVRGQRYGMCADDATAERVAHCIAGTMAGDTYPTPVEVPIEVMDAVLQDAVCIEEVPLG